METQICTKCNIEKLFSEFHKDSRNSSKFRKQCKLCMNKSSREYKRKNKEKIHKKNKEYFEKNRELNKIKCREYKIKNPSWFKNWQKKNESKRKKYLKKYNQKSLIRVKNSLRSRINYLMNNEENINPRTLDLLGCKYDFLISHLESKFTTGMSWENYGYYGWHIDHIIPLSSAKTVEELKSLYHYSNLQPLWSRDNLSKGNKIIS